MSFQILIIYSGNKNIIQTILLIGISIYYIQKYIKMHHYIEIVLSSIYQDEMHFKVKYPIQ